VLINFLKIRAVVNGKEIYSLPTNKPVIITVTENNPKVVITDGYHVAKPIELVYHHLHTYYFKVICVIDNMQLLAGFFLLIVLFLIGFFTGIFVIKMASFLPVFYFLFFYYVNRKEFLQITPV
jgi:cobalamin biosynthesis protein CobD/CbiB